MPSGNADDPEAGGGRAMSMQQGEGAASDGKQEEWLLQDVSRLVQEDTPQ